MSSLRQLEEDRAMRDIAKGLVSRDFAHLRGDLKEQGVGKRALHRIREGAEGMSDEAQDFVSENREAVGGVAALAVTLGLVWIFRDTISEWFHNFTRATGLEEEPGWRERLERLADQARSAID